jgi:uncharacterized protein (DUF39 family)
VPTGGISSYIRARTIAELLKKRIAAGTFLLSEPVQPLPSADAGITIKMLPDRAPRPGR